MAEQTASMKNNIGKCLQQHSWMQERAVASPDIEDTKKIHGHKGIFTTDQRCKMDTLTTYKATHVPLMGPGVRLRGIRRELLEKHITQVISGSRWSWCLSPAVYGREAGYTLDRSPVHRR
ncbi:hypothetical protein ILYODFUR_025405, partial [Ilyodon furcidens]